MKNVTYSPFSPPYKRVHFKSSNIMLLLLPAFVMLLHSCHTPPEQTQAAQTNQDDTEFKKQVLTTDFISEGVAIADVNKDGNIDILAGAYWFESPNWEKHEIDVPQTFSVDSGYSNSFLNFAMDVNEDGWMDLIKADFPGTGVYWYENPQNKEGHWKAHQIHNAICNESPAFVDLDGNKTNDLVFANADQGQMSWFTRNKSGNDISWETFPISQINAPGTQKFSHGLGVGDINRDGRNDIMVKEGWWQAPANRSKKNWRFHDDFQGEDCSQMYVYDFDKDGDNDVITCSAHDYGIWWYEQINDDTKENTWIKHTIYDKISQTHSSALADINGDGEPDLITGKRYFAHNGHDPGSKEPAVLYWFELRHKNNDQPYWMPHLIDSDSGSGLNLVVEDISGDGLPDIVTANKKGVFYFEQVKPGT